MDWLRRKDRIKWELEQLRAYGFDFDEPIINDELVTVPVFVDLDGDRHRLEVDFFELFPYFRFEVRAPSLSLDHHQNPFGKNLCLLPRPTRHWDVGRSLAAHLREQLPKILATGWNPPGEVDHDVEEQQAEPVTTYFPAERNTAIFFDSGWSLPANLTVGRLTITRESQRGAPFRGAITEISTLQNAVVVTAPPHLKRKGDRIDGYVVQLSEPILENDAARLYERVRRGHLQGLRDPGKAWVLALVMPEEHVWRSASGCGWLFIIVERGRDPYFARPVRAGETDLRVRAPELLGLASKTVAQFGLGCVGAISAIEFAKVGLARLRILDHDSVDAGTVIRWYLGLPAAGRLKPAVIADFLNVHFPLTETTPYMARIGSTPGERAILERMIEGASLIYDATAEEGVSYFLADLARHRGIPYVGVTGTRGGWGGVVVRLRANRTTGCWYCFERAKDESMIPMAAEDTHGVIQPTGCADPTFTGAGFDLATVSLTGVRTAVATLLEGQDGYPSAPSDVTVISFRDADGQLIQPKFTGVDLPPFKDCPACGSSGYQ